MLQQHLLILTFDYGEVAFNSIKLWAVRNVIDRSDFQSLVDFLHLNSFVDIKVVHE